MPPFFVVLLLIALASFLLFQRTVQEIYRFLTAVNALICLILGFAFAPWQVQLVVVFLLLCWERFYHFKGARSEN